MWLGSFIGLAVGFLSGAIIILATYPELDYGSILFMCLIFGLSATFTACSVLYGMEYWKARKTGMLIMWADYQTDEILDMLKEHGLRARA